MKLWALAAFLMVSGFSQSIITCATIDKCQELLRKDRRSSLLHFRIAELYLLQSNYLSAANEFRESLAGDKEPKWTEVWSHINLGRIYDMTDQRARAINEYTIVLKINDNSGGAVDEATEYIKVPYKAPANEGRSLGK